MRQAPRLAAATLTIGFAAMALPGLIRAQNDAAKTYKANCVLCHAPDGSGSTTSGKALKAQDLRSDAVQKKPEAELTASITNGKGKMPAFGKKLKADDITQLVAYIRTLPKK
jgi:cytochrome c6